MDRTKLHPLHALYLGQGHGEAGTLPLRARLAREGVVAGHGSPATGHGAATLRAGLGLAAAALAVAHLVGKPTIVLTPAAPAPAIGPAPAGAPRVPAPTGLPGWPEGEPTWEDAEWR